MMNLKEFKCMLQVQNCVTYFLLAKYNIRKILVYVCGAAICRNAAKCRTYQQFSQRCRYMSQQPLYRYVAKSPAVKRRSVNIYNGATMY